MTPDPKDASVEPDFAALADDPRSDILSICIDANVAEVHGAWIGEAIAALRFAAGRQAAPQPEGGQGQLLMVLARSLEEEDSNGAARVCRDGAATIAALEAALSEIAALEPSPFYFPEDWSEQVAACPECRKYKGHPIQNGICDTHRRPIWDREAHAADEEKRVGWRAKSIAKAALTSARAEEGETG